MVTMERTPLRVAFRPEIVVFRPHPVAYQIILNQVNLLALFTV